MMQKRVIGMICALALLSVSIWAGAQSRAKKAPTPDSRKQVTITLVRWPYT